ncbi:hypothetical protein VSR34_30165 [Paraburkholderia sp. JHI2823]|uniref:hypothetical protein n=1 Tax=Paraburkholderia sp. JHI2823 TaxID=3112960 RepID=UPI003177CBA1
MRWPGLSVGLGGGLVGLGQSMASAVRQGQQSGDSRLAAVQAVAAAEQAYQNRGGIKDAASAMSNGNGCLFGVCAGLNHAVGGSTAIEVGFGVGGVTKAPNVGGNGSWGYSNQMFTIPEVGNAKR